MLRAIVFVLIAFLAWSPASAARFTANAIVFQDVTAAIEIVTHEGDEIDVVIRQAKTHRTVEVSQQNGKVVVKGERWREDDTTDCCNDRIRRTVDLRMGRETRTQDYPQDFFADYPTIFVSMPRKGAVDFIDARMTLAMDSLEGPLSLDACYVHGEIGDLSEAAIGVVAGSRLVLGDVGAGLEIDISGDATVMAGKAASVDVDIAGRGEAVLGAIDGMLDVSIAGSGTVRALRLDGPLTVRIAGSGAVAVQGGRADRLKAIIEGTGGVIFRGAAVQPDLRLTGSAEVRLDSVRGRITRAGSGQVYIGGELLPR